MSLDKAIEHGKEKRQPYRGSKAVDRTCENHKGCPWCEGNRTRGERVQQLAAHEAVLDAYQGLLDTLERGSAE